MPERLKDHADLVSRPDTVFTDADRCQAVRDGQMSLSEYLRTNLDAGTTINLAFIYEQVLVLEVARVVTAAKDHGEQ